MERSARSIIIHAHAQCGGRVHIHVGPDGAWDWGRSQHACICGSLYHTYARLPVLAEKQAPPFL